MPSKGTAVTVDGYGTGIFAGAVNLDNPDEAQVMLKFEGAGLDEGYGNGIITIPLNEYKENRVHPEQLPNGVEPNISTEKRDEKLK